MLGEKIMMVHTADPVLQLAGETADSIGFFIALVLLTACTVKLWKRMKRNDRASSELEDEDGDLTALD